MSHISDSDHRRIEATVYPDCIVESHQISDVARGWRGVHVTKLWRTEGVLGRGASGEVLLQALDNDAQKKRALKVIRGMKMTRDECHRELTAMIEFTKLKYQSTGIFVEFFGWFQHPNDDSMYLAMHHGDLEANLLELEGSTEQKPAIPEEDIKEITSQILEGLKIMHAEGFAHRDLKPKNIFVVQREPKWWVKLGDFGLTKKQTNSTEYRTQAGTEKYMAPELYFYVQGLNIEASAYTNAVDIWALGCIVYRIITQAVPFPTLFSLRNYSAGNEELQFKVLLPITGAEAVAFVKELLNPYPDKRPTANTALEHSWIVANRKTKIIQDYDIVNPTPQTNREIQSGYNTLSHAGLQSRDFQSPPETHDVSRSSLGQILASEPLPEPKPKVNSVQQPPSNSGYLKPSNGSQAFPNVKPLPNVPNLPNNIHSSLETPTSDINLPVLSKGNSEITSLQIPSLNSPLIPTQTTEEAIPSLQYLANKKSTPDVVSRTARNTLYCHSDHVWSIAFSPDGKLLASASRDKTAKLWETATGEVVRTLKGHSGAVGSVDFSPDGELIATGSRDATVRLWSTSTGTLQRSLRGRYWSVRSVRFSPNGKLVASLSQDGNIKLWDAGTGQQRNTLKSNSIFLGIQSIEFSRDSKVLASGSLDGTIKLWDAETGKMRRSLKSLFWWYWRVYTVAFSPDSKIVASGTSDGIVRLWDVATGVMRSKLQEHPLEFESVIAVVFSPDGKLVASAPGHGPVRLWDATTGEIRSILRVNLERVNLERVNLERVNLDRVQDIRFSPDGKILASASLNGTIRLWDTATGAAHSILKGHTRRVWRIVFSPDGKLLASTAADKAVRLWDTMADATGNSPLASS